MIVRCPKCGVLNTVGDEAVGQQVVCPMCRTALSVSAENEAPAASAPPAAPEPPAVVRCPRCGGLVNVANRAVGEKAICQRCGSAMLVPGSRAAAGGGSSLPRDDRTVADYSYGRASGAILGALLLVLIVIPLMSVGGRTVMRWDLMRAPGGTGFEWLLVLSPAMSGGIALLSCATRKPTRGALLLLAGLLTMGGSLLWLWALAAMAGGMATPLVGITVLMVAVLVAMLCVVGGHSVGRREIDPAARRTAVGIPSCAFVLFAITAVVVLVQTVRAIGEQMSGAPSYRQPQPTDTALSGQQMTILLFNLLGLMGCVTSVVLGMINMFMGRQVLSRAGYICGVIGCSVIVLMGLIGAFSGVWAPGSGIGTSDAMVGVALHTLGPLLAASGLVAIGWAGLWMSD